MNDKMSIVRKELGDPLRVWRTGFDCYKYTFSRMADIVKEPGESDSFSVCISMFGMEVFGRGESVGAAINKLSGEIVKVVNGNPKCAPDTGRGYFIDPDYLSWKELAPIGSTPLEDQGGGPRGYVDAIGGLCVKNPLTLGKITALD